MKALIVIACLLLMGCTTLTPAERIERKHEREARALEHRDAFIAYRQSCEANGGMIHIKWFGSPPMGCRYSKDCLPRTYDSYMCVESIQIIR